MANTEESAPDPAEQEQIRAALTAVTSSVAFDGANRLTAFLTYVVEETLAGRGELIRAKRIATDVYGRHPEEDPDQETLIRVDAGRLRRRLTQYYAEDGQADPVRIIIRPGGYRPEFETQPAASEPAPARRIRSQQVILAVALVAIGAVGFTMFGAPGGGDGSKIATSPGQKSAAPEQQDRAMRTALRERSVPALQASNIAEQARGMFFPVFDRKRQLLALEMFRHAIDLDSGLSDGYSGAAQVLATLALLSANESEARRLRDEAVAMADKALELTPSDAWALAAKGWTQAIDDNFPEALQNARLALDLAPEDGHVLDLVGITAIVAETPDLAALVSDPDRPRSGVGRFGARNIWGVAQLMLGNHTAVVEAFGNAPAEGAPIAPPSLIFSAVALDKLGRDDEARDLIAELRATWPDFPAAMLVGKIFHDGTPISRDILGTLDKYGFQPGGG